MVDSRPRRLIWLENHPQTFSYSSPVRTILRCILQNHPPTPKAYQVKKADKTLKDGALSKNPMLRRVGKKGPSERNEISPFMAVEDTRNSMSKNLAGAEELNRVEGVAKDDHNRLKVLWRSASN
ncbi:hypothetical protein K3495_g11706 [Podosphaera aphanis]|nr:hypothetical protein K3495_g11706 [Podosphaera aphanis]